MSFILGAGTGLGQLAIAVLGVLLIASEYSTGVIRASLLAVPKRLPMLAAKAVVFAVLIFVVAEIVTFSSFFIGSAMLHSHAPVSLSDPASRARSSAAGLVPRRARPVLAGHRRLIRHTAGAIATAIGVVFVLPIRPRAAARQLGSTFNAYLPEQAGGLIAQAHQKSTDLLSPWQGFGVFCLWTAILLAAAGYLLKRRDA